MAPTSKRWTTIPSSARMGGRDAVPVPGCSRRCARRCFDLRPRRPPAPTPSWSRRSHPPSTGNPWPDALLISEQKVVLGPDPRELVVARGRIAWYLDTPNYLENLRWLASRTPSSIKGGDSTTWLVLRTSFVLRIAAGRRAAPPRVAHLRAPRDANAAWSRPARRASRTPDPRHRDRLGSAMGHRVRRERGLDETANGLFAAGDYAGALADPRSPAGSCPSRELAVNAANADHKLAQYPQALPEYGKAIDGKDLKIRATAHTPREHALPQGRDEDARTRGPRSAPHRSGRSRRRTSTSRIARIDADASRYASRVLVAAHAGERACCAVARIFRSLPWIVPYSGSACGYCASLCIAFGQHRERPRLGHAAAGLLGVGLPGGPAVAGADPDQGPEPTATTRPRDGLGSGVVVNLAGDILTSLHVVDDADVHRADVRRRQQVPGRDRQRAARARHRGHPRDDPARRRSSRRRWATRARSARAARPTWWAARSGSTAR